MSRTQTKQPILFPTNCEREDLSHPFKSVSPGDGAPKPEEDYGLKGWGLNTARTFLHTLH